MSVITPGLRIILAKHLAVICADKRQKIRAAALAAQYQCPCRAQFAPEDEIGLLVHADYLSLQQNLPQAGEVLVDFVSGKLAHRRLYGGGKKQPLARALGLHKKSHSHIFDATGGWGRDAWVLACLGATVTLSEQQALLVTLLEDGLARAKQDNDTQAIAERLCVLQGNSIENLATEQWALDAIYLDPMYPKRQKSAAVKKDMQLLQALYADNNQLEQNNQQLLLSALQYPCQRVVVKRPLQAPFLAEKQPQTQIKSKNTRYDVYFCA